MEDTTYIINLKIKTESDLYSPFDPEKSLNEDVKTYIIQKTTEKRPNEGVKIRIICPEPVNEQDVKNAISKWIDTSQMEMKRLARKNLVKMIWLFIIGIVLISLSLFLQPKISTLLFTIITTVGTFSIWEGASIWIIQGPDLRIRKKLFEHTINSTEIEFVSAE